MGVGRKGRTGTRVKMAECHLWQCKVSCFVLKHFIGYQILPHVILATVLEWLDQVLTPPFYRWKS